MIEGRLPGMEAAFTLGAVYPQVISTMLDVTPREAIHSPACLLFMTLGIIFLARAFRH